MTYQFEMKDEISSDGEPVLSRILKTLRKTMEKYHKIKEIKIVQFFLLSLLKHVYDNTCMYDNASTLTLV